MLALCRPNRDQQCTVGGRRVGSRRLADVLAKIDPCVGLAVGCDYRTTVADGVAKVLAAIAVTAAKPYDDVGLSNIERMDGRFGHLVPTVLTCGADGFMRAGSGGTWDNATQRCCDPNTPIYELDDFFDRLAASRLRIEVLHDGSRTLRAAGIYRLGVSLHLDD